MYYYYAYVFVLLHCTICTHLTAKKWILLRSCLNTVTKYNIPYVDICPCSVLCKLSFRPRSSWHFISRHQRPHKVLLGILWHIYQVSYEFIKSHPSLKKNIHDNMCTEERLSSILQLRQGILAFPPSTVNVWSSLSWLSSIYLFSCCHPLLAVYSFGNCDLCVCACVCLCVYFHVFLHSFGTNGLELIT